MEVEKNKYENPVQPKAVQPGNGSDQSILDRGAKVYGKAEQAVSEAYDKTAKTVSETYEQAKSYGTENPGKTILIALGIGVGLGFLLGASSRHRSRTGRLAQPVVNALSEMAEEFFR